MFIMSDSPNSSFWINCSASSMTNGTCSMNVYKTLGSVDPKNKDLKSFAQDTFAGLTMFIGFVVLAALVFSGFLMVLGGGDEKQYELGKKWVIYSIIWLLLVGFAYGIIRLIQLFAKG